MLKEIWQYPDIDMTMSHSNLTVTEAFAIAHHISDLRDVDHHWSHIHMDTKIYLDHLQPMYEIHTL